MMNSLLISFIILPALIGIAEAGRDCSEIDLLLSQRNNSACHCFVDTTEWIGCTAKLMPKIYRALTQDLDNETFVEKLWLWDNFIPTLPLDIFHSVRPRTLIIERSQLHKIKDGVFDKLGSCLEHLELKNNMLKSVNGRLFEALSGLRTLDLSGNRIDKLTAKSFGPLTNLVSLSMRGNHMSILMDHTFGQMHNLRTLDLAHNQITQITKKTFAGLIALEHLNLGHNKIIHIDRDSFDHLKNLKSLNLGDNLIQQVSINNLGSLQKLYLDRNQFQTMTNIDTSGLTALQHLSIDRNELIDFPSDALEGLPQLRSLSLVANKIEAIEINALVHTGELRVLSLQNNSLSKLPRRMFEKLPKLERLFLSDNNLEHIDEGALYGLHKLMTLDLSRNRITTIDRRAFSGLGAMNKLYIDKNNLTSLINGTFHYLHGQMKAVDLSENNWLCKCNLLWLFKWMEEHQRSLRHVELTRCHKEDTVMLGISERQANSCRSGLLATTTTGGQHAHSPWITVFGVVLTVVSLLILTAIVLLYLQDGWAYAERTRNMKAAAARRVYDIRRVPSDMVTLIPKCSGVCNEAVVVGGGDEPTVVSPSKTIRAPAVGGPEKKVRFAELPS